MPAIVVQDLHKSYGSHVALRGIDFEVGHGEVVGFLGPNGAGKTTTMRILTGFLAASAGSTRIEGHDVISDPILARQKIGYLPENAPIYPDMQVHAYLDYMGRIRELGTAERARAIERVAVQCGISGRLSQKVGALSKGFRQRVGLAQAMLHEPSILILDEPTTGLDPNQIVEIRNVIREIGRRKTVLLSTHILSEVQATCDRVLIINQGAIVADGRTDVVTAKEQGGLLIQATFAPGTVNPDRRALTVELSKLEGVQTIKRLEADSSTHFRYEILADKDLREDLFYFAQSQGVVLLELARAQSNLEEVFRRLTHS
ncbi:MAG: ABC transporter [Deltaproteobacteria bacterium]|nr:ABC transporter [Deltaproteobacteria bacterium]